VARAAQPARIAQTGLGQIPGIDRAVRPGQAARAGRPAARVAPTRPRLRLRERLAGAAEVFAGMPRDVKGILALVGLVAVLGVIRLIFAGNPEPIVPVLGFSEPVSATPFPAVTPGKPLPYRR
jgi:hypothetical protein